MLSNTGVNKVILLAAAKGPFTEVSERNLLFTCFRLVTTEYIKKGYQQFEHLELHEIKIPEKLLSAERPQLSEGMSLFIEGKIQTTAFVDEQHVKRYRLEIVANRMDILSKLDLNVVK